MKSKNFCVRPKVSLEVKVYLETYYHNSQNDIQVDETPTRIQVHNLQIIGWTLTEKQQFVNLNIGPKANPQYIKVNSQLTKEKIEELQMLFKEFKYVFT
jgi:hypothetical protein